MSPQHGIESVSVADLPLPRYAVSADQNAGGEPSVGTERLFHLYYGDGPAYAMLTAHKETAAGLGFFHTSDRVLVEHLVFQLQRDLGIPISV